MKKIISLILIIILTLNVTAQENRLETIDKTQISNFPSTINIIKKQCNSFTSKMNRLMIDYDKEASKYLVKPNVAGFDIMLCQENTSFGKDDTISYSINKYIKENKQSIEALLKGLDSEIYTQTGFIYVSVDNKKDTCLSISEIICKQEFNYLRITKDERVKKVISDIIIPNMIRMREKAPDYKIDNIGISASYRCSDFSKNTFLTEFFETIMFIANVNNIDKIINLEMTESGLIKASNIYLSSNSDPLVKVDIE